ncbi:hypothetical protein [Verrucomicrobium sp. 3C]|uniref:hypothetical protein n=1 Tax=Verrucomicrobium sp. 3C TaxID=1134055 RepID=UPI0003795ECA|nr:hypothetical protein [Verrucomicrobium sp. 3C]
MRGHSEQGGRTEGKLVAALLLFLIVTAPVVFVGWGFLNAFLEAQGSGRAGIGSLLCLGLFLLLAALFGRFLVQYSGGDDESKRRREV